jgi:DNA-directed RNA polymerase specialized sigma subunit, sigma24 homolog
MDNRKKEFFDEMYKKYHKKMVIQANRIVRNMDLAQDIMQQAFAVGWQKIDEFIDSDSPIGWITLTTQNTAKAEVKKRKRQTDMFVYLSDLPENLHLSQVDEIDPQLLFGSDISKEEYYMLKRRVLERASFAELAEELHITVWACEKRMKRLLKKIKQKFDG